MDILKNFGTRVFNDNVMRQRLPREVYESIRRTRKESLQLDVSIAETVASAMKDWAIEQGATHYVHWFQPMTDSAAGKSESFIAPSGDGTAILEFSSRALVQGEPDASSFPSGGIRNTFEARGYTAWDPTSSVFVKDDILYIPTAFCGYNGESLDQKTPLLRSMDALSRQAVRVLRALGDEKVSKVIPQVGAEQEYFLIDRENYENRLDLKICGRTLLGAAPPKSQELDDHYYGRVRLRVSAFMKELDQELWAFGIAAKTKHNEVAPAQHELATVYDTANVTCDANQLVMETMRTVAKKQGLACLLHEKPFARVNGSGKHNNYSLATDTGDNLLSPGKDPAKNTRFLIFLCAFVQAVDTYADLLRLSTATPSNDHRLGGFEAPPAIISMFLGDKITSVLQDFAVGGKDVTARKSLDMGVSSMPFVLQDDADRNRTSPFAFTGNKFEFRMLGSSQSIALANTVLDTALADSLSGFADILEGSADQDAAVKKIVAGCYENHNRIIFNGNNYSDEWRAEATRRGLSSKADSLDAIAVLKEDAYIQLFKRQGVFSEVECASRYEVMMENFHKIITIEAATLLDMVRKQVVPALTRYAGDTAGSLADLIAVGVENPEILAHVQKLSGYISSIRNLSDKLAADIAAAPHSEDILTLNLFMRNVIRKDMELVRTACDEAEVITAEDYWPMPNYTDLMHRV